MSAPAAERAVLDWEGYATRWSLAHGGYDPRSASPLVRGWMRLSYTIGATFARAGLRSPDAVTVLGLLLSVAVPFLAFSPWGVLAGAVLVLLSAIADTVDGVLAVIADRASRLGQVYDAAADRVAEACWLVTFVLAGAPPWAAAAAGGVMWLHEYVRARASLAGMSDIGAVTVSERPTRILVTIFGLLAVGGVGLALPSWRPDAATVVLAVMLALSLIGFAQLAAAVRKALR